MTFPPRPSSSGNIQRKGSEIFEADRPERSSDGGRDENHNNNEDVVAVAAAVAAAAPVAAAPGQREGPLLPAIIERQPIIEPPFGPKDASAPAPVRSGEAERERRKSLWKRGEKYEGIARFGAAGRRPGRKERAAAPRQAEVSHAPAVVLIPSLSLQLLFGWSCPCFTNGAAIAFPSLQNAKPVQPQDGTSKWRLTLRFRCPFYTETVVAVSLGKMVDSAVEMALGGVRVYRATGGRSSLSRETCTA